MSKSKQIIGLDGLRFAAAMMVLLFHLAFWNWTRATHYSLTAPASYAGFVPFVWFGWIGVEIFFVLSGFVIAYSTERSTAYTFFQHRLTRLFPAAIVCASLTVLVLLTLGAPASPRTLAALWLKSIFFFPLGPWIDDSYWTLCIEVSFYAIIFVLLRLKRLSWMPLVVGWIGSVSTAFWIAAFLPQRWSGVALLRPMIVRIETHETLNILLVRHGCYFAIGVFLWLCLYRGATKARLVLLLFWCVGGGGQIVFRTGVIGETVGRTFSPVLPVTVWVGVLALIVAAVIQNEAIHRAVGSRGALTLRRLGLVTYPLYLLHQTIGIRMVRLFASYFSSMQALVLGVVLVIALAYFVSRYVEPPLQQLLRAWFNRATKPVPPPKSVAV